MSRFTEFVDGSRIPPAMLSGDALPARPTSEFEKPVRIHTGKAESQWIGELLLRLSARGGQWHGVPYRMLRNEYMSYGPFRRLLLHGSKKPPPLFNEEDEEPAVTWIIGSGRPPLSLLIGLSHLAAMSLVARIDIDGDAYFFPTERLLSCAVTREQPMTLERHIWPFGYPKLVIVKRP